jgi:hypothetical protein
MPEDCPSERSRHSPGLQAQANVQSGSESSIERRTLNPLFVEWLMGFPIGWTDLEHSGMESFQTWRRQRGEN